MQFTFLKFCNFEIYNQVFVFFSFFYHLFRKIKTRKSFFQFYENEKFFSDVLQNAKQLMFFFRSKSDKPFLELATFKKTHL